MMPNERAQMVRAASSIEWRGNKGHRLEKVRDGHKLIIEQEPSYIYNKQDEIVGVDAWVKLYGPDGNEVKIDPHRRIINPPTVPRANITVSKDGKTREVVQNPVSAFYEAVWDSVLGTPNRKGWRTRGTVTTVYSDTSDGFIRSSSGSYSSARSGTGFILNTTGSTITAANNESSGGLEYNCYEGFLSFDTSSIDDLSELSSVVLSLFIQFVPYSQGGHPHTDFTLEAREQDWGDSLTTGDWIAGSSVGSRTLLASYPTISMVEESYQDLNSETAFLSASNMKTGSVRMVLVASTFTTGSTPASISSNDICVFSASDILGTTEDPKLTITHSSLTPVGIPSFTSRPNRIWRRR